MGYRRTRSTFHGWQTFLVLGAVIVIFAVWQYLNTPTTIVPGLAGVTPTLPDRLTSADVLPTLTPDAGVPLRQLIFPAAQMVAPIVESYRVGDSWEVRNLGNSVGHLAGTSWLDDPGGNIALVAHIEDAKGNPGPFADLSQAKIGDVLILRDGQRQVIYHVRTVGSVDPDDIQTVAQDGRRRVTLITCSDWDIKTATYLKRLIVVAVPVA